MEKSIDSAGIFFVCSSMALMSIGLIVSSWSLHTVRSTGGLTLLFGLLALYGFWCANKFYYPLILIAIAAIGLFLPIIIGKIRLSRREHPVFNASQKQLLAQEKEKDATNREENEAAVTVEKTKWESLRAVRVPQIDSEMDALMREATDKRDEITRRLKALNENTTLGEDEKQLEIIDWLIYFIESRRADSIK